MIKGIVFDLDGTLVDSLSATFEAFNYGLVQMGAPRMTAEEILKYFGPGEGQIFANILGPEKAEKAYEASMEYMNSHLAEVPLHEGIAELLEQLQRLQLPMSIFTGRSWPTTELILKHHGLINHFVTIVASEHVNLHKPSPEGLHLALSRMQLSPQEILFIGDSPADMIASRSAGAKGVAALWDLMANRNLLEPHQPQYWAKWPKDILSIVETC